MPKRSIAALTCRAIALLVAGFLLIPGPSRWARGQEATTVPQDTRAAVTRHLDMTYSMPEYRTREEWLARRDFLRGQILAAAGLLPAPDKCALNAQIFGRLDRDGYSIEKVYFESYAGFLVTGNLYRPRGRTGPYPGVLSPHGHWANGRLQDTELCSVPSRCIMLARQGYVVFSYDMVGYMDSRQVNHRVQGEREALWGFGSLGLHLWNSIRSVDFLTSLPEVDKSRVACTGASGGGTQTFLLTAVDDRITLSAPVNMISSIMQGGDVCENAPNLRIDTNNMEIGAMMAPRPMIMVSATGDWTRNTLEVEYPAIQKIYLLLGAEDKITAVRVQAEHNYNRQSREHVYRWFAKWFLGTTDPGVFDEKGLRLETAPEMLVFYGREMPPGLKSEKQIIEEFLRAAEARINGLKPSNRAGWETYKAAFAPVLKYSLMSAYPRAEDVQTSGVRQTQKPAYTSVLLYLSRRGVGDRIPVTVWLPGGRTQVRQAVLLAHPEGAQAFEQSGVPNKVVEALLWQGCSVTIPDLFNTGRATFQRTEKRNYFTTYNRTDDANRIQDILTCLSYVRSQSGPIPVKVAGLGQAGMWCLLARALAEDDAAFCVDANQFDGASDEAFLKSLNIPLIRRAGDLRTAAVMNPGAPLWIHNAGNGFPTAWIQSVYEALGKSGALRIETQRADEAALLAWLQQGSKSRKQ